MPAVQADTRPRRILQFLRDHRHKPPSHIGGGHDRGPHGGRYTANYVNLDGLLDALSAARDALGALGRMTDEQLASVPLADSFRFCDGQRTTAQVITNLLSHQRHQLDALKSALA
jgi:hypothetical protein